ncbi:MAG: ankyrin repeat domain-containing protein, partial [Deltaproteobacteria bacterium]
VELLLEMGAPANCQSFSGWSALMQAACRAHLELVKLLLRHGADPVYRDHEGRSALAEMASCVPGLRMTELIYCEEYAVEVLGKERLAEIKATQGEIERLIMLCKLGSC